MPSVSAATAPGHVGAALHRRASSRAGRCSRARTNRSCPAVTASGAALRRGRDRPCSSVITLNAVACAKAVDDYVFSLTGLLAPGSSDAHRRYLLRGGRCRSRRPPSRSQTALDIPRLQQTQASRSGPWLTWHRSTIRTCWPHLWPHQVVQSFRIYPLTWSPLTESNRRPSPYHLSTG